MSVTKKNSPWWKDAVVYQVYPRSFQDSDGDGIGDLPGITARLPYLRDLGVDIVWLSPVYASPNDDNGYDISDYRDIMAEFGTLEDFDRMLATAHELGLKVMMDLVVNHTSDEHEWFRSSRSSKDSPHRDWYIWRDPAGYDAAGEPLPPNNWGSEFGGPAWEYDAATGQFYLHMFSKKQPDLNWHNPEVREEILEMIRWWQDRGVDGWRVDAICTADKPEGFPDDHSQVPGRVSSSMEFVNNGPRVHEWLHLMDTEAWSRDGAVTVGELAGPTPEDGVLYTAPERAELDQAIHFEHVSVGNDPKYGKWSLTKPDLVELKRILNAWQVGLHGRGWSALYWDNHDQPRAVSRFGDDSPEHREASAKTLATVMYLQQGTPYIYQGQELGMTNTAFADISEYRDLDAINWYTEMVQEHGMLTEEQGLAYLGEKARDHARTPMQWEAGPGAGFTSGTPWIRVNPNAEQINAAEQAGREDSVLAYYRRLLALRHGRLRDVVVDGAFEPIREEDGQAYAYDRVLGEQRLRVIGNFTGEPLRREEAAAPAQDAELVLSNYADQPEEPELLRPWEARVWWVSGLEERE